MTTLPSTMIAIDPAEAGGPEVLLPVERPVPPSDLAATVYSVLGIDPNLRFDTPDGQPIRLVDKGEPIAELF